jgi:hypothetical protein
MIPRHIYISAAIMFAIALGLSFYLWHMRGRARMAAPPSTQTDNRPVPPPAAGPTEQVTLYVADDEAGQLQARLARIPLPGARQARAEELLRSLLSIYLDKSSPHPLGTGSEIRNVYLVDPGLAVIDLNEALADGHRSGILVEELTIASLAETLSTNLPGITRVKFLVEGKERETLAGHADLSQFYEVSEVNQMAAQFEGQP